MFDRKPRPLLFRSFAQIASKCPREEIGAFGHTLDLITQDQCGRLVNAIDLLHRVAAHVHWPPCEFRVLEARPRAARTQVGGLVRPVERRTGRDRQVDVKRVVGGDHAKAKAALGEWHRKHAILGQNDTRALRKLLDVDVCIARDMPARRPAERADIARNHHRQLGASQVGARDVAAADPVATGLAGRRLAAKLDQEDKSVGVRGRLADLPIAGPQTAHARQRRVQEVGRGLEVF